MKPDDQYGLLIEPVNRYGTEYIEVRVCRREDDKEYPLGCPSDVAMFLGYGTPKHMLGLTVDGLGIYGFISDYGDPEFIGTEIEFRDVHSIDARKLGAMLKAINRVNARVKKDEARTPADKFISLAAALKLGFACERIAQGNRYGNDWRFMSVPEGRNRYRELIEQKVSAARERKLENA